MSFLRGCTVDIVTGRPCGQEAPGRGMSDERAASLARTADKSRVLRSDDGKVLIDLVFNRFVIRVRELANADPEAKTYLDIFAELGHADRAADIAAGQLASAFRVPGIPGGER